MYTEEALHERPDGNGAAKRRKTNGRAVSTDSPGTGSMAIGPKGTGAGIAMDSDFIAYSTVKGAFAGLAIDGSVLDVRGGLNSAYYGKKMTPVDILGKQHAVKPESAALQAAVKKAAT